MHTLLSKTASCNKTVVSDMKRLLVVAILVLSIQSFGQRHAKTSTPVDTAFTDYNVLFKELDKLIDSISKPRSFGLADVSIGDASFDFYTKGNDSLLGATKLAISPMLGYFHQSGLGLSAEASIINDGQSFNPYQFSVSGFYDYLKNRNFITGTSISHYFTKKNLAFYTSPLENEMQAYFTYRKKSLKPSASIRYGWGSEETVTVQEVRNKNLKITRNITTQKDVASFTLTASLRYDFYQLDVLSRKDYLRITPQISLTSGSEQYGFNQVSSVAAARGHSGKNASFNTENTVLNTSSKFQPLSLTTFLKTEYSKGRFFVQPQLAVDYYLPAATNNLYFSFLVNAGFLFL